MTSHHIKLILALLSALLVLPTAAQNKLVRIEQQAGDSLIIYFPQFSRIDFVCADTPVVPNRAVRMKAQAEVIMMVAGAFTGQLLDVPHHSNINSTHVSNGIRYNGANVARNTGAFFFYNGSPKFIYGDGKPIHRTQLFADELAQAVQHGGMGFGQEMMVHNGQAVRTTRPAGNRNLFRALCLIDGCVAVADARDTVAFGTFIRQLIEAGAQEALYLDMGTGWNYSWWRQDNGSAKEIHMQYTRYSSNWVTFYR